MKRLIVILLLVCVPGIALAAEKHVLMLLYRGCEEACQGFQDYFRKHRLPVRFTVRDVAQDKTRIPGFIAEAKKLKPDLILTWGTTVTQEVAGPWNAPDPARHITDIPLIFMIVTNPIEAGLVQSLESSKRNLTGTLYLLDEEIQLRAARSYFDFRHLGLLVNPAEQNSLTTRDRLRQLAPVLGFQLSERTFSLDSHGKPRPEELPQLVASLAQAGADLLYQSPDTFLNLLRDQLTGVAMACKLPVFAASEAPVLKSAALMGVVNRYSEVGRLTAQQAARILFENVAPASIPIALPRRFSFLINMNAARQLERYPPLKLLDFAEVIDDASAPQPSQVNPRSCN
jgi:putative ABC transport system substrate-binding protein